MGHLHLSYSEPQAAYARALAEGLDAAGQKVWCQARDRLLHGADPIDRARQELSAAEGALVLLGPEGISRWQEAELGWALELRAANPHYLILTLTLGPLDPAKLPGPLQEAPALKVPPDAQGVAGAAAGLAEAIEEARRAQTERLSGRNQPLSRASSRASYLAAMGREEGMIVGEAPTIEAVEVEADGRSPFLGAAPVDKVLLLTIHGGRVVPARFMPEGWRQRREVERAFEVEKDWGANQLAWALTARLGLSTFHRVNVARALMDFGRFPGITDRRADHLHRFAISGVFSELLSHEDKRSVLSAHYDAISDYLEPKIAGRTLLLTLHTYDEHNHPSGTRRPPISLIHTPIGYHRDNAMPFGVFDPLYPDELGESTADRKLVARLALAFESVGAATYRQLLGEGWDGWRLQVGLNHPYHLPDGSLEVRAQVWHFFDWLRQAFDKERPDLLGDPAFALVWKMLLDTNLRRADTVAMRSFLHMYRDPPEGSLLLYGQGPAPVRVAAQEVMAAYRQVQDFVRAGEGAVVRRYRRSSGRLSALTVEVRKDLLWRFQEPPGGQAGRPVARTDPDAVRLDNVHLIAHVLAEGLARYFREDVAPAERP